MREWFIILCCVEIDYACIGIYAKKEMSAILAKTSLNEHYIQEKL